MFGIGETEFIIILIFGFLLFGPDKLPGMGRTIGRVLRQFREASEGFTEVVQTNIVDPATQELTNTGSNKRAPAAAQVVDEDDEDLEETEGDGGSTPRRETFAERKARLAAERRAREEAATAEAAVSGDDADVEPAEEASAVASDDVVDAPASASVQAAPAQPSVADLYTRGSRRSSRAKAEDDDTAAGSDSQSGEGDGNI